MWNSKIINCLCNGLLARTELMYNSLKLFIFAVCLPDNFASALLFLVIVGNATFSNLLIDLSPCKWTVISGREKEFSSNQPANVRASERVPNWVACGSKTRTRKTLFRKFYKRSTFRLWLLQSDGWKTQGYVAQSNANSPYMHVEWDAVCDMSTRGSSCEWSAIKLFSEFIIIKSSTPNKKKTLHKSI